MVAELIAKAQNSHKAKPVKGIISVTAQDRMLHEKFKGTVVDKQITFPKKIGAEHPFDFEDMEKSIKKIGIISGAINKIKEAIVGDFSVSSEDANVDAILQDFVKNTNFTSVIREWIKEGLLKGNGFIEIDLKAQRIQVLNANKMFVKRDKNGNIKHYNQLIGKSLRNLVLKDDVIKFQPGQIAHLKINKIANDPYGIGIVYPSERVIENLILKEQDTAKLISRKAGAPIHVTVGQPGESIQPADIDAFNTSLQFMNNRTEWVTDGNVKMEWLKFDGLGDSLLKTIDHDMEMISAGMEIPAVLFGKANVPEGLAKVQLETFQRKIASIREEVEILIVNQIFKPLLAAQSTVTKKVPGFKQVRSTGLAADIKFTWNLPGEEEKNKRVDQLNKIIQNPFIDEALRRQAQIDISRILDLGIEDILPQPEKTPESEEVAKEEEKEIQQPEVPGAKPTATAKDNVDIKEVETKNKQTCLCEMDIEDARNMDVRQYVNITELPGFNYSDYLIKILQTLKTDKFVNLKAITERDIELGLLPESQVDKLRIVLRDGFRKNKSMRQIEKDITRDINLKDRFTEREGKLVLSVKAKNRANLIARSETVRLSNQGLKNLYQENKIEEYEYLAALDDRTSDICNSLSGRIFPVDQGQPGVNMPPMHPNCRSTIIGVVK